MQCIVPRLMTRAHALISAPMLLAKYVQHCYCYGITQYCFHHEFSAGPVLPLLCGPPDSKFTSLPGNACGISLEMGLEEVRAL